MALTIWFYYHCCGKNIEWIAFFIKTVCRLISQTCQMSCRFVYCATVLLGASWSRRNDDSFQTIRYTEDYMT